MGENSKTDITTIYKKTELFDDAIRRVLKSTPYACINDLRTQIQKKLGLELAKETLIRRLKNLRYHYQKFEISKPERHEPDTDRLCRTFKYHVD